MVTRQRQINKNQESKDASSINSNKSVDKKFTRMSKRRHWSKIGAISILAILFLLYFGLWFNAKPLHIGSRAIDKLAVSLNLHKPFYTVIIDAGSTASRVIAFTFHFSVLNQQLILDDELFYETKPGLSSYAENPKEVEKSLKILLLKAKSKIPQTEWSHTPLTMKATAGLRLLPGDQASNIIQECKRVLNSSGFKVSDDSVSIMDGSDEGIFSWFSANFLLDRFSSENKNNFLAAFDLGGGSTQVTFVVNTDSSSEKSVIDEKNVYNIKAFDQNMSVFTNSYLGMGLNAARKEILIHPDNYNNAKNDPNAHKIASDNLKIHCECINPIISNAEWSYGGKKYLLNGAINGLHKIVKSENFVQMDEDRPIVRFSTCLEIIRKVVKKAIAKHPPGLAGREILAFSYYFERAVEADLIDPFLGGTVAVKSFHDAAQKICEYPNTDQPFMCLDLSFIYVLLHDGFGLHDDAKILLRKKINGHELNWALGVAFNILQNNS